MSDTLLSVSLGLCLFLPLFLLLSLFLCLSVSFLLLQPLPLSHIVIHRLGSLRYLRFPAVSRERGEKTPVWVSLETSTAAVSSALSLVSGRKAWFSNWLCIQEVGRGSLSFPAVPVGLQGFGSWAAAQASTQLCAQSAGCWREEGLSLGKRESGARVWPRYITFRASSETKKDARGREGAKPRGEASRTEEAAQGPVGVLGAARVRPATAREGWVRRLDMLRAREGPGCEAAACWRLELGPVCPRDSLGSESAVRGPEVPAGDAPRGPGSFSSYRSGGPIRPMAAPRDSPTVSERRGSQGSEGCIPPGSSCPRPLWVRALGGSGAQKRSSSEADCVAGAHGKRPDWVSGQPGLARALGESPESFPLVLQLWILEGVALELGSYSDTAVVPATPAGSKEKGSPAPAPHPRLPIPAPNTQLTRRRRGLDWEDQAAQPAKQLQLCAILSFADAGVENLSPPHHIRGWIPLAPGARLALAGFFNKTAHLG